MFNQSKIIFDFHHCDHFWSNTTSSNVLENFILDFSARVELIAYRKWLRHAHLTNPYVSCQLYSVCEICPYLTIKVISLSISSVLSYLRILAPTWSRILTSFMFKLFETTSAINIADSGCFLLLSPEKWFAQCQR